MEQPPDVRAAAELVPDQCSAKTFAWEKIAIPVKTGIHAFDFLDPRLRGDFEKVVTDNQF
jgi:hypothetical protein